MVKHFFNRPIAVSYRAFTVFSTTTGDATMKEVPAGNYEKFAFIKAVLDAKEIDPKMLETIVRQFFGTVPGATDALKQHDWRKLQSILSANRMVLTNQLPRKVVAGVGHTLPPELGLEAACIDLSKRVELELHLWLQQGATCEFGN
ncbi:MAG: hypothetical protein ABI747_01045 [Candidatus Moraniibacteriota bacterium]